MSVEQKQIKNLKNKVLDFVKKADTEKLIKLALYCKIKIPDELLKKWIKKE